MPKREDIKSILIIGAGPIVIGQACEFDYSGAQACKALREEGYRVILVNSNPATIMTDPKMADATYIEPIEWKTLEKIIEKEKPSALLPTMGGQTALNCALDLDRHGVLQKHNVEMIGANKEAIDKAEDRELFRQAMLKIGLDMPKAAIAHSVEDALKVQETVGYPTIIRPSFTMGGSGGGIAYNKEQFIEICQRGLDLSPTNELLIEESILGVVGSLDKPGSPFGEAMQAFHSELNGRNKASAMEFRQRILAVTSHDLKRVAEQYLRHDLAQTAVITNVDLAAKTGLEIMAV